MFWILFLFIISINPVIAAPIVTIITTPSNIIVGNSFPVTFTISSGDTGFSYRYKIVADTESNIITQPLSSCSGNWDNCPIINIGNTDPVTATAYAKLNNVTSATIKIRIAQDNNHSSVFVSNSISISGISPTPTFTPTPTPTQPSNTPVPPTSTPMPTSTAIPSVTVSPRPTSTKLPSPTITPTPLPTETPYFEPTPTTPPVIDSPDDIPDLIFPTPTPKAANFSITPTIISIAFITVGCLLLLIPVLIIKLNR